MDETSRSPTSRRSGFPPILAIGGSPHVLRREAVGRPGTRREYSPRSRRSAGGTRFSAAGVHGGLITSGRPRDEIPGTRPGTGAGPCARAGEGEDDVPFVAGRVIGAVGWVLPAGGRHGRRQFLRASGGQADQRGPGIDSGPVARVEVILALAYRRDEQERVRAVVVAVDGAEIGLQQRRDRGPDRVRLPPWGAAAHDGWKSPRPRARRWPVTRPWPGQRRASHRGR